MENRVSTAYTGRRGGAIRRTCPQPKTGRTYANPVAQVKKFHLSHAAGEA